MNNRVEKGIAYFGEHEWKLPDMPTDEKDILFSDYPVKEQYWRRQEDFPKFFYDWSYETKLYADITQYDGGDLVSLNKEDSQKLIDLRDRELKRRIDGVWFMNDGKPTYMTGGHYFMLQWVKLAKYVNKRTGDSYGEFREFQMFVFYFLEMCKQDDDCAGGYIIKPKKTGVTQLVAADYLDESTRMKGRVFGVMSKAQVPDCRDVNFMYYMHGFRGLPEVFKPSIANDNMTNIKFGNPVSNKQRGRKAQKAISKLDFFETHMYALPTKSDSFDGAKWFRAWCDEFPKYKDPYPDDVYKKTVVAVKMQEQITGKFWITSYTPEKDDRSYIEAKKIYYESKLKTKSDKTRRTKSNLYCYFISVLDSAEGTFDIYGRADRAAAKLFVDNNISLLKDDKPALQAFKRQNPVVEEDAWREGGGDGSVFDNIRLAYRKDALEADNLVGLLPYVECNLRWVGERLKSQVTIDVITEKQKEEGKSGRWRFHNLQWLKKGIFNRTIKDNLVNDRGLPKPAFPADFMASLDPVKYALKSNVVKGSKNALWVMNFPDIGLNTLHGQQVTNRGVCEYLYRQERPKDTYEDVLMTIFLFSCPIGIESNIPWVATKMIEDGLEEFLMVQDKKTKAIIPYSDRPNELIKLLTTQSSTRDKATVDDLIRAGLEYFAEPMPGEFDNLENVTSIELINDLLMFDPENTHPYDSAISWLYCLRCMQGYTAWLSKRSDDIDIYNPQIMSVVAQALLDM